MSGVTTKTQRITEGVVTKAEVDALLASAVAKAAGIELRPEHSIWVNVSGDGFTVKIVEEVLIE